MALMHSNNALQLQVEGQQAYYRVGRNYSATTASAAASPHFLAERALATRPELLGSGGGSSSSGFGAGVAVGDGNQGWVDLVMRRSVHGTAPREGLLHLRTGVADLFYPDLRSILMLVIL